VLRTSAPLIGALGVRVANSLVLVLLCSEELIWKRALSFQCASLFVSWVAAVRLSVALQVGVGVASAQLPWSIV
jgi:hypothetical protein